MNDEISLEINKRRAFAIIISHPRFAAQRTSHARIAGAANCRAARS
jgi:peptide subunit release factor RF-3